ncbi:unnamed protein product [Rotaria sp. Silwood1]|nr:unnamed protein product [Rotaria sp. Silwood1]CAF1668080.1 unnamed protein product [Rotaria sp. Silwood1]
MDVNRDSKLFYNYILTINIYLDFYNVLPEIFNDINNADYVAIDGEFTGVIAWHKMKYFDTPAERYKRHYECDRHYLMVQIGLAMIRCINPAENQYTLRAYNFYVFPEGSTNTFDFQSKSSSLQFLAAHRFDFAQLFQKGKLYKWCSQYKYISVFLGIPFVRKTTYFKKLKNSQFSSSCLSNSGQTSSENNNNERKSEVLADSSKPSASNDLSNNETLNVSVAGFSAVIWKLQASNMISNTALNALYKIVCEPSFPQCRFETVENFQYASGEYEHTAGYDATCTAVCMAKMMAYIAEKTDFKQNPIEHASINIFTGKVFHMRSFDIVYSDMLNDDHLPDRSCVFYVTHPKTWSTTNIREFFSQWNLCAYDQLDSITHIIAVSLENDTMETMLTKMRTNDRNLIITSYAVYNDLDTSNRQIMSHDHLFHFDLNKRKSNKRTYDDQIGVTSNQKVTTIANSMNISSDPTTTPPSKTMTSNKDLSFDSKMNETTEPKEQTTVVKRIKLVEDEDEDDW